MGKNRTKQKKSAANQRPRQSEKQHQDLPSPKDPPSPKFKDGTARNAIIPWSKTLTEAAHPTSSASASASASASSAAVVYLPLSFPSHVPRPPGHDFLLDQPPYRESFQTALETSYEGFAVDSSIEDRMQEATIQNCLQEMQTQHYFRRDVTQPFGLGTKCAKTYVTRCLVGDPGTTYRYLGLRMFAHPWTAITTATTTTTTTGTTTTSNGSQKPQSRPNQSKHANANSVSKEAAAENSTVATTTQTIHKLSHLLSERTQTHLQELDDKRKRRGDPPTQGRSNYDICLINCMDPSMEGLKPEPSPTLDLRTTVSWHADSSLEHYSSIAVYQTLVPTMEEEPSSNKATNSPALQTTTKKKGQKQKQKQQPQKNKEEETTELDQWYVAMRVTPHAEGPTVGSLKRKTSIQSTVDQSVPPIAASLPSGSAYYLLDDFNHHHQHTVLLAKENNKPSCIRYSCTFRLLRDSHNIEYMVRRCQSTISHFHKKGLKLWRSEQLLLTEIEHEWIRQFFIQGSQHYELLWNVYWGEPMQALLRYWSQLEHRTKQTIDLLQFAAQGKCLLENANSNPKPHHPPPTKAERKLRDKQKKALTAVQGLLERTSSCDGVTHHADNAMLYESLAELLEERAHIRSLWAKREKDHVFTELPPELRPMPIPFQFQEDGDADNITHTTVESVSSPLPGNPDQLRELATLLRAYGKAFVSGRPDDLPLPIVTNVVSKESSPSASTRKGNDSRTNDDGDQYSKPLDWCGWAQPTISFGLELQDPFASAIMEGRKEIETRSYDLPPALLGKRLWILESPSGTAGVSAMGNTNDLTTSTTKTNPNDGTKIKGCKVLGWCTFKSIIRYTSRGSFEADESRHLVSTESGYGWKDGTTKVVFGWVVGECGGRPVDDDGGASASTSFVAATRRMRSLFELKATSSSSLLEDKPISPSVQNKKTKNKKRNTTRERPKKRQRY